MDFSYCNTECPIGKQASENFLRSNGSALDAAMDFSYFIEECSKTCNNKEALNKGLSTGLKT